MSNNTPPGIVILRSADLRPPLNEKQVHLWLLPPSLPWREVVAHYDGREIIYNTRGKPLIANSEIRFNHSSSEEQSLLAMTLRRPLGVDIEKKRPSPRWEKVSQRHFTASEQNLIQTHGEPCFLKIWTLKEAFFKAIGTGVEKSWDTTSLNPENCCDRFELQANHYVTLLSELKDYEIALAVAENNKEETF